MGMFHIISDEDMYRIMRYDNYIVIQGCSSRNCILAFLHCGRRQEYLDKLDIEF